MNSTPTRASKRRRRKKTFYSSSSLLCWFHPLLVLIFFFCKRWRKRRQKTLDMLAALCARQTNFSVWLHIVELLNVPRGTGQCQQCHFRPGSRLIIPLSWLSVCISHFFKIWKVLDTVKSQIFVRYLISYFRTFEKSAKFNTEWKFVFVLRPSNINVTLFWGPREYEN